MVTVISDSLQPTITPASSIATTKVATNLHWGIVRLPATVLGTRRCCRRRPVRLHKQ